MLILARLLGEAAAAEMRADFGKHEEPADAREYKE